MLAVKAFEMQSGKHFKGKMRFAYPDKDHQFGTRGLRGLVRTFQ